MKICQMSPEERPREKLMKMGAAALSSTELLSIILRTGTGKKNAIEIARDLLAENGNRLSSLALLSTENLKLSEGIGPDKAATLVALFELVRRMMSEQPERNKTELPDSKSVFLLMEPKLKGLDHEECWLLYLTRNLRLIGIEKLTSGTPTSTGVDVHMVMTKALAKKAQRIIMVHNHPEGNPLPGQADLEFTMKLKSALTPAGMMLLDHVIIGDGCFYSFSEEQLMHLKRGKYNKKRIITNN